MDQIGRYRILGELGRGGMGIVYRGEDVDIGRPVAIKTLHPDFEAPAGATQTSAESRDRLRREAQAIGALSHPYIVMVYDLGQQDGMAYIVMEFIEGMTLERRLDAGPALSMPEALQILVQIASALDYAHGRGVVHRDVKPANILLQMNGPAKITDFGIAKLASAQSKTTTGMVVGSANYMAPEQLKTQPVSGRTDQFALGVMAYQMLTGNKPFDADTLAALVTKILFQDPPPPQTFNTGLGPSVEVTLRRALSKEPDARFATCCEFIDQLSSAVGLSGFHLPPQQHSGPNRISGAQAIAEPTAVISPADTTRPTQRRMPLEPPPIPVLAEPTQRTVSPEPIPPPGPARPDPIPLPRMVAPDPAPAPIPPQPRPRDDRQPLYAPYVPPVVYGDFWPRALATFIDCSIIWGVSQPFNRISDKHIFLPLFHYSVSAVILAALYETIMIKRRGATIGKKAMGLRVVMVDGGEITWQVAFGRFVAKGLNYLTLFTSFLIVLVDPERRALEDRLCNTRVIRVRRKARERKNRYR